MQKIKRHRQASSYLRFHYLRCHGIHQVLLDIKRQQMTTTTATTKGISLLLVLISAHIKKTGVSERERKGKCPSYRQSVSEEEIQKKIRKSHALCIIILLVNSKVSCVRTIAIVGWFENWNHGKIWIKCVYGWEFKNGKCILSLRIMLENFS